MSFFYYISENAFIYCHFVGNIRINLKVMYIFEYDEFMCRVPYFIKNGFVCVAIILYYNGMIVLLFFFFLIKLSKISIEGWHIPII
jgi:hypothetical protein